MEYKSWIEGIDGLASLYSFDIQQDGSFSEIRLMAVNQMNSGMLMINPDAPDFYPGIPYRTYWMDLNFENFIYKCGSTHQSLYSYVNARGVWLKGFYIPITASIFEDAEYAQSNKEKQTVYALYILMYSNDVETDSMSQQSADVSNAVMNISIKLHETEDFYQAMALASGEIEKVCGAEKCAVYTVDKSNQKCIFINKDGIQKAYLDGFTAEMERTPFEIAEAWEKDLALSDCLLLDDLSIIKERDPVWYDSLTSHGIKNIILFAIRNNQTLVGFIWAANFATEKMQKIKETLELTTFLIAAVIANHQLVSQLEEKSTIDGLTQVSNRNAMNERVDGFSTGETALPTSMGVVFADLNGLKTVNDNDGHDAGDKLLSRAAALLKISFGDYEIYRAGGDEFVIFCPDITEEKLEQLITQLKSLTDSTDDVSLALGTVYCKGEYDIHTAMQNADEKMYQDKEEYYRRHPEKDRRKR